MECESVELLKIIYYVKLFLRILLFIVPVVLVIMGSVDALKVVSSSPDQMKTIISKTFKRVISAVLVLFVPTIVDVILSFFGDSVSEGLLCLKNASKENINIVAINNVKKEISKIDKSNISADDLNSLYKAISNVSDPNFREEYEKLYNEYKESYRISIKEKEDKEKAEKISMRTGLSDNEDSSTVSGTSYDKTIFVGDSLIVGMCRTVNIGKKNNCDISKAGMGYSWLISTALPLLKSKLNTDSNCNVVIGFGANDYRNSSAANNYAKRYLELKNSYPSVNLIIVSGHPVDDTKARKNGYEIKNSDIVSYNKKLKSQLDPSIKYCDVYNAVKSSFGTIDGLHYNSSTYKKMYSKIQSCIKQ